MKLYNTAYTKINNKEYSKYIFVNLPCDEIDINEIQRIQSFLSDVTDIFEDTYFENPTLMNYCVDELNELISENINNGNLEKLNLLAYTTDDIFEYIERIKIDYILLDNLNDVEAGKILLSKDGLVLPKHLERYFDYNEYLYSKTGKNVFFIKSTLIYPKNI